MIDAATVVWVAPAAGGEGAGAQGEDARRSLEAWGRARGVELTPPTSDAAPAIAIDWAAGDDVEKELARAREAISAIDLDEAERALARAEARLRDHPELPQAAWLRAEVARGWSARFLREGASPENEARARRAWQRGAALDGGRAAGLGEKSFDPAEPIAATIAIDGEGAARLDGSAIAPGRVTRGPGEHALVITRPEGSIAWAGWVSLAQGTAVRVAIPDAPPCSEGDVARARIEGDAVRASDVRCRRWVAVVAVSGSALRVATCEAGSCGPLVAWRASSSPAWVFAPAPASTAPETRSRWPAWATWAIAGASVAGAAVAIVVATGALKSAPTETRFVNGGLQIHSF